MVMKKVQVGASLRKLYWIRCASDVTGYCGWQGLASFFSSR